MRTNQTQGLSKQPSIWKVIIYLIVAVISLTMSTHKVMTEHVYPTGWFIGDLLVLFVTGLVITSYRTNMYKWKRAKAWEDQLRKDSE